MYIYIFFEIYLQRKYLLNLKKRGAKFFSQLPSSVIQISLKCEGSLSDPKLQNELFSQTIVRFRFSGLRIAVGYNDGSVKVFNLKDLSVLHTIKTPKECVHPEAPILCMDAHPNNNLVTYGDDGGNVVVLQTQGGKVNEGMK